MKIFSTKTNFNCPKCGKEPMGMKCGNTNIYGCLSCKNAQGLHFKMRDAKRTWKVYVEFYNKCTNK